MSSQKVKVGKEAQDVCQVEQHRKMVEEKQQLDLAKKPQKNSHVGTDDS